jgi:selenocysteine lyase/cysteine desulfurase
MTRQHSDDVPQLVHYTDTYRPGARRYDVGETSNFALVPAITAALKQTLEWGVDNIHDHAGMLTDGLVEAVGDLGLTVTPHSLRARHLIGVHLAGAPINTITAALESAGVFVSVRGDAMRVSPHVYNDASDIDRLVDVLASALGT